MRQALVAAFFVCVSAVSAWAADPGYQSFIVGNPDDARPSRNLSPGLVLMGGGTDVDEAFQWMCQRAGGGDFLIIRTSGADGYNAYIQKLCPQMDSVETIVIESVEGANSDYVASRIKDAEALWIAGGDQSTYTELWRGTSVQTGVNYLLNSKRVPVGGTSAGLAVLSQFIYTGAIGSAKSNETLANPFYSFVTLEQALFQSSLGRNKLYDSHFVRRDRMGRTLAFLAHIVNNGWAKQPRAIGVDEKTALLVLPDGHASIVGTGAAYFLQSSGRAKVLAEGIPLTYLDVRVFKVSPGGTFDFNQWKGTGGTAYTLNVNGGVVSSTQAGGSVY